MSDELGQTAMNENSEQQETSTRPVCPACGGELKEIRVKLVCANCHRICETCCEGGRG